MLEYSIGWVGHIGKLISNMCELFFQAEHAEIEKEKHTEVAVTDLVAGKNQNKKIKAWFYILFRPTYPSGIFYPFFHNSSCTLFSW